MKSVSARAADTNLKGCVRLAYQESAVSDLSRLWGIIMLDDASRLRQELEQFAEGLVTSATSPSEASGDPRRKVKVIVAVHGIGNQMSAATISSVATQFCRYMG